MAALSGDPFPKLTITTTDEQTLTLPDAFAINFAVVLLYRGRLVPVLPSPRSRKATRHWH